MRELSASRRPIGVQNVERWLNEVSIKFDPAYCLTCECYPDGAIAADDPISTDRPRQVAFPACSTRGAVGGSGLDGM